MATTIKAALKKWEEVNWKKNREIVGALAEPETEIDLNQFVKTHESEWLLL